MVQQNKKFKWPDVLQNGGQNGKRILARDWSKTSLGPIESWSAELRFAVVTCMESRFPMALNWGPELIQLYNDAAKPIMGGKDESLAFGTPVKDSYSEIWDILGPMFISIFNDGLATWVEDQQVIINRHGFQEECYFTWSYSPVRNADGEIKGIITNVIETTLKVIGERRLNILKEMASRTIGQQTLEETCFESIKVLKENDNDIPFAVIRILNDENTSAKVVSAYGIKVPDRNIEQGGEHFHPVLKEILKNKKPVHVKNVPADAFPNGQKNGVDTKTIYVLPLFNKFENNIIGFLSVGLNSRRPFDDVYKNFLDILSNQLSISLTGAKVQEAARCVSAGQIKRLGQLIDASPDHIFVFDREGRYVYHNQATGNALKAQMISLGRGDEPTLNLSGYDMEFEPDFLKRFMFAKDKAFEGRISTVPVTFPTLSGPRDFECILSPIYDENGAISSVAGITRDVTDLKQSIKIRDEFLSIASHELKTPLTTLKLQTQMRARTLKKGKTEVFNEEKLAKIFREDDVQINRLNRLVDDMLDASRLNAGKIELHLEQMDIFEVINEVLDRLSLHLENQNINVVMNVKSVNGKWDRYRMEQVFTNLLTNAMKYGDGKPIEIQTEVVNGQLVMTVADHGMGIKPEDQKRIFKQFERAISSSSVSGLGLGLYIVKEILKTHGGKIKVESVFGSGSKFIVTLPLNLN